MGEFEGQGGVAKDGTEAARARIENARMTRRQALRKFGFTAGMTAFAMVSVDDLARMASKKLQENEATKGIGDTLAKEFRTAGVALADPDPGAPYYYGHRPPCNRPGVNCTDCCENRRVGDQQMCFAQHSSSGECGTWPNPDASAWGLWYCRYLHACLGEASAAQERCENDCADAG